MATAAATRRTSKRRAPSKAAPKSKPKWPEFVGEWPRLIGRQEPEFESRHGPGFCSCCPGADEGEGDRCAQFGFNLHRDYGTKTRCMPWQWSTIRGMLSLQPPNEWGERVWTHRDVCIEATRQQGKTLIVVLLILFYLFVAPCLGRARPLKIVYTAQRWSTAKDVFTRTVKVINRVPWLKQKLARNPSVRDNHGLIEVVVERDENGAPIVTATAEFAPRSQEFGRGVTELDILFLDEAYDIDPGIENDLTGAQSASENPQTIYLSTAPVFLKHPKCHSLADMHRLGFARAPMLFYRLFAAPRHFKRDNPAAWVMAQPSHGIATDEREVWSKLQKAKNAIKRAIFEADYLGWGLYPPPEVEDDTEIPSEKWNAMGPQPGQSPPQLVGPTALVLERSPDGSTWVMVGAQRTTAGKVHIEVGYCQPAPGSVVVERVVAVLNAFDPIALGARNRSGAAELETDLVNAGFDLELLNGTEVAQACGGFLTAALGGGLSHRNQSGLNDAVSGAVKKKLPAGGFVWELVDEVSFPMLMGASLAHYLLVKYGQAEEPPPKPAAVGSGRRDSDDDLSPWGAGVDADFDVMTAVF